MLSYFALFTMAWREDTNHGGTEDTEEMRWAIRPVTPLRALRAVVVNVIGFAMENKRCV